MISRYFKKKIHNLRISKTCSVKDAIEKQVNPNQIITVYGWIRSLRKMKNVTFALINDGTTGKNMQAVLKPDQGKGLSTGCSVKLTGLYRTTQGGSKEKQEYELHVNDLQICGYSDPSSYPLQKKHHDLEYLREKAHLRLRTESMSRLLRLRSFLISIISSFFSNKDYIQTHPPILTSSDCEGSGKIFKVESSNESDNFFKKNTYLTVSTQLHLEALSHSLSKVWSLSPTFRAEKSRTSKHLAEFYMLEAEISFINDIEDLMSIVEQMIHDLVENLKNSSIGNEMITENYKTNKRDQINLENRWNFFLKEHWTRITYAEAINALKNSSVHFKFPPKYGHDLQTEHEKWLTEKYTHSPLFIINYPKELKPFYMRLNNDSLKYEDHNTVSCFDLLIPQIGELAGGSLREERIDILKQSISTRKTHLSNLSWYIDLRRWGTAKHGGFGLGFDRFIAYLAGIKNIKDVMAFPRWHQHCNF
ncbi:asparagine-tRNA ligase [Pneumocystis murina B123]|uniref:Asparagine--tRNA ligase, mitochondrial n=1 Tax=Pneumocystis murina (strain B123) TaxID=1069680 RepID=M7P3I5_PNEMU|nr:asparagine-tRNA ligase [Pneumocystis murina B123]EMR08400.1 asparagine-tRNA ligase [Pneumocystis murina B123]